MSLLDEALVVLTPDSAAEAEELGAAELTDREGVCSDPVPTQSRATPS
jgi:hypothetical protein